MQRLVPVPDPKRKNPSAIRLTDIPRLFSEGSEPEEPGRPGRPTLAAVKSQLSRIFRLASN